MAEVDPEEIQKKSQKHLELAADRSLLENWYPNEVVNLPLAYGRLVCQRCNIRWDAELRKKFNQCILVAAGFTFVMFLVTKGNEKRKEKYRIKDVRNSLFYCIEHFLIVKKSS